MAPSVDDIRREIEARLGFVPPFFEPAFADPALLDALWRQTVAAYLDGPIPARFKEVLFAGLSRFCRVPYCIVCHSCALRPLGMTANEILELLARPTEQHEDAPALARALGDVPALDAWPDERAPLWGLLLSAAQRLYLGGDTVELRARLDAVLGPYAAPLRAFIHYVKTCHAWVELHPELALEADRRVIEHLGPLIAREPGLRDFFAQYVARVAAEERRRMIDADPGTRRLAVLAELSQALSDSSDDEAEVLARLADAALPHLADWCIVDFVTDRGTIERTATSAVSARHRDLLLELRQRFPPRWDSPQPAVRALRSGVPELLPIVDHDVVAEHAYDAEHRALILALEVTSAMAVPILSSGDRAIGAITFGMCREGRSYAPEDVRIGEEFARRAASVLVRARDRRAIVVLEQRLRIAIDSAAIGIWDFDPETGRVAWDARCHALFGLQAERPVTLDVFLGALHPDDRDEVAREVARCLDPQGDGRFAHDYRVIGLDDGIVRWLHARGRAFFHDGRPVRMLGTVVDIADRKRAEEESRVKDTLARLAASFAREHDQQRLLQLITDETTALTGAAYGAFFFNVRDADGGTYMLYTISGRPREAFEQLPMPRATELFQPTFRGEETVLLDDVTKDPRYGRSGPQPPGHPRVTSYLAVPVVSRSGEVHGGLFFGHPEPGRFTATHARLVEGITAHAAVALENARLLQELRESERAAQEAHRRKDEFLALLGHELRNPLAPMVTALELLKLKAPGTFEREREILGRQVRHLSRLVDDLLDVSRITRGKIDLARETIDVARVVADALEVARPLLEERRHEVALRVPRDQLFVDGDAVRLAQVLSNLLTNAAKYTPPGGRVRIEAAAEGDEVAVRVLDSGIGIADDTLPTLFAPFVQGSRGAEPGRGLGLGLAIVRNLVELHGGRVEASSDGPGQGSQFAIWLPAAVRPGIVRRAAPRDGVRSASAPARRRVLVVDDNDDAANLLAAALETLGHDVAVAFDGPQALDVIREFRPDVAVVDIGLPVMDGYELARRLCVAGNGPAPRLWALTGFGQASDRERALAAGFEQHFVKPVDLATLAGAIAALPRRPE